MRKIKVLLVITMLVLLGLVSGCAQITSDVTVNSDLTGVWKAKILLIDPSVLKKTDLEKEFKRHGIEIYTISPTKGEMEINGVGDKEIVEGFEVTVPWKNQENLKKIVDMLAKNLGSSPKEVAPEVISKKDPNNSNVVTVNLGIATYKVVVHVPGVVVKETIGKGSLIDDKTIEFTTGQPIVFKFIMPSGFMGGGAGGTIAIVGGLLLILGVGFVLYRSRKKDNKKVV